ncbi:type VI secretion system ATPase TssH [Thauera butanivorans]|uniref:type VI secretion system ATPase TssH n=1 Tax=Thauera butanivorans TaxID=86174 RepID=UPI003AB8F4D5
MSTISRVSLFGKLNPTLYKSIEGATVFAKLRGNPLVELCHWLYQLLQLDDSDVHRILRDADVEPGRLVAELQRALERLPNGANGIEDLSSDIDTAVERAWMQASVNFGAATVRSGHLLLAALGDKRLRSVVLKSAPQLERIDVDRLGAEFGRLLADSPEASSETAASAYGDALAAPGESSGAMSPAALGKAEALKKYTVDLTARARAGEIDPVTGRDDEIRQIIDILMRRRQNNPILTGEAGVGKTAVVEGFALRIAAGEVPPSLAQVELRSLDIGLLQAGASMKGEFEQRLRQLIDEVQHAARPVILFIDEIHTLVGAGGAAGTGDAANLLKPALARGTLRTVGATTWSEYKKYIEKDPALTRRFQVVQVHEPDEARAIDMLRGIVAPLERHHGVSILDDAVRAAVSLSHRYIPARQLPDKAVALLDTAAARVAISQHATPGELEDLRRRMALHQDERTLLLREQAAGQSHAERIARLDGEIVGLEARVAELEARWEEERALVAQIVELRGALFKDAAGPSAGESGGNADEQAEAVESIEAGEYEEAAESTEARRARLVELEQRLQQCRGEQPLVTAAVDEHVVASVVADWTGIPVGRMVRDEARAVIELADSLGRRVIGQREGLEAIARRIQTARAKLSDPRKPVGVFMLCGPSGVGKTETALALAENLYGGEQNLITINMSEFQEAHTVSTLKGAPPGYVGYGEGGVLTEAVRRRPYSVILLDEIEKAHPDVHEIFFQVFDKGRMEDGEGREIDFRNTVILLTSNVGTEIIDHLCANGPQPPSAEALDGALRPALLEVFPPALLGRLVVVPYVPLAAETLSAIVRLQLERVRARIERNHGAVLEYDDEAIRCVLERCHVSDSGGRMIDAVLTNTVLPEISRHALEAMISGRTLEHVRLSAEGGAFVVDVRTRPAQGSTALQNAPSEVKTESPEATMFDAMED